MNLVQGVAETGFTLGRPMPDTDELYWPVAPLAVVYRAEVRSELRVIRWSITANAAGRGKGPCRYRSGSTP